MRVRVRLRLRLRLRLRVRVRVGVRVRVSPNHVEPGGHACEQRDALGSSPHLRAWGSAKGM